MGETGSGKTTQLPQYIQDARLINGQIGVTQVCFIFVLCCRTSVFRGGISKSRESRRIEYNLCSILLGPREIMLHKTQFLAQK